MDPAFQGLTEAFEHSSRIIDTVIAGMSGFWVGLEHFPTKWTPVRRQKML
jgi:hypothetical protein